MRTAFRAAIVAPLAAFFLLLSAPVWAQDGPQLGWADVAELSFVLTGGNAESSTLAFNNSLTHTWSDALFRFDAGGLRANSTTRSRFAIGATPADFEIVDESSSELTAANYFARGRYERTLSDRLFWYTGAGWDRNTFAGIDNRYSFAGGVGHVWFDNDLSALRTDYAVTLTAQDNVASSGNDTFAGLRASWAYRRQLADNTRFDSTLIADENLSDLGDFRIDTVNSVSVSMNDRLALKVGLRLLYDNEPSLEDLALQLADGTPTGLTVLVPLDEIDSIFTVALVVNF